MISPANVDFKAMERLSADIRIATINGLCAAGFGHIGGSASVADVLAVLYGGAMRVDPKNPDWDGRDYLVMSKGHCGPGLYAALAIKGFFPMDWIETINKPGTRLPSHCDMLKTPGIDVSTGSLGQGISVAAGMALACKMQKKENLVYCIIGDGEANEGQVWETVQFAAHRKLDNFIVFIDWNKKQLDGTCEDICDPKDFEQKLSAFGWDVRTVKGYDVRDIYSGLYDALEVTGRPKAIILDTIKGMGCSFAEKAPMNHYMVIDRAMADEAIAEIEKRLLEGTYPGGAAL